MLPLWCKKELFVVYSKYASFQLGSVKGVIHSHDFLIQNLEIIFLFFIGFYILERRGITEQWTILKEIISGSRS